MSQNDTIETELEEVEELEELEIGDDSSESIESLFPVDTLPTVTKRTKHRGGRPLKDSGMSYLQIAAIELIANRKPGEKLQAVADAVGISRRTLYRYMQDIRFRTALQNRIAEDLYIDRGAVARALVAACLEHGGANQAAMQKIYWSLTGDLRKRIEISGPDGGPVEINSSDSNGDKLFKALSLDTRRKMIEEIKQAGLEFIDVDFKELDSAAQDGEDNDETEE